MNSISFQNVLQREITINKTTSRVIACLTFALLMAIGAYVRVPLFFTPVPLTLQTFFVLLSGAVLGRKWGALSQMLYLSIGALGLPVFQGHGYGMSHILGPTGGYLLGFICASYIVGYFTENVEPGGSSLKILQIPKYTGKLQPRRFGRTRTASSIF